MEVVGPDKDVPAPDVNTTPQVMAWFMDTYSMHVRQNMPGVVTGKPLEIGGSRGRVEATGRGVTICALDEMAVMGLRPEQATIAIQGFGNVGRYAAKLFEERGCKIVGISDVTGAYYNEEGINVFGAMEHTSKFGTLEGFKGGDRITNTELLDQPLRRARSRRARKSFHCRDCVESSGKALGRGRERTDDAGSRPNLPRKRHRRHSGHHGQRRRRHRLVFRMGARPHGLLLEGSRRSTRSSRTFS